jgi:hypothetical protein
MTTNHRKDLKPGILTNTGRAAIMVKIKKRKRISIAIVKAEGIMALFSTVFLPA